MTKELVTTCLLAAVPCLVYKPLSGCTVVVRASSGVDAFGVSSCDFWKIASTGLLTVAVDCDI